MLKHSSYKLSLIGLGNRYCRDDAIGLVLLEEIAHRLPRDIDVRIWEDMDALSLAHEMLSINNAAVIVDCADMGLEPGEYRWLAAEDCRLETHFSVLSTHGLGFAEAMGLAKQLGFNRPLNFFVVQPHTIEPGLGLSDLITANKSAMVGALWERIQEHC